MSFIDSNLRSSFEVAAIERRHNERRQRIQKEQRKAEKTLWLLSLAENEAKAMMLLIECKKLLMAIDFDGHEEVSEIIPRIDAQVDLMGKVSADAILEAS